MPNEEMINNAIDLLAEIDGLFMDPVSLAEDVLLLAASFPDEDEYAAAVLSTKRALQQIVAEEVTTAQLERNFSGWESYHYQHKRAQGAAADMRLVFRRGREGVQVQGFGHRNIPVDIYRRLSAMR